MANQVLYGFLQLKDKWSEVIAGGLVDTVADAVARSVAYHNELMNDMISLWVSPTTRSRVRYQQIGQARLQPLDEDGRARPIKPKGYYDVGFPILNAGTAWGANFVTREQMTVDDANRITALMTIADRAWVRDQILAALLSNGTWTYTDPLEGAITIQPIANGDAVTFDNRNGTSAADTHQLAQAAAILDASDPFPSIYTELTEHPENTGEVIAFIPSNLVAAVQALTGFHQTGDPNIIPGNASDRLAGTITTAAPGTLFGYHDAKVWLFEWAQLPSNYIIATTTGGEPTLGMRQHPQASLQGFVQIPDDRNNHPYYERQYARWCGFGAWNRVGSLVYRIGNASYAVPAGYDTPIP